MNMDIDDLTTEWIKFGVEVNKIYIKLIGYVRHEILCRARGIDNPPSIMLVSGDLRQYTIAFEVFTEDAKKKGWDTIIDTDDSISYKIKFIPNSCFIDHNTKDTGVFNIPDTWHSGEIYQLCRDIFLTPLLWDYVKENNLKDKDIIELYENYSMLCLFTHTSDNVRDTPMLGIAIDVFCKECGRFNWRLIFEENTDYVSISVQPID